MKPRINLFSTKDSLGMGEVSESSLSKKKLKETTKKQALYNTGKISKSDYKMQVKDIRKI